MAQLKDRWHLLAIALLSDAGDADEDNDEGATEAKMDKNLRGAQASLFTSQKT